MILLRLRPLAQAGQQKPQVVVAVGQCVAVYGHGGEVGGQLLPDGQGLAIWLFRLPAFTQADPQNPQVVVAVGQSLAVFGHGGELRGQPFPHGQGFLNQSLRVRPLAHADLRNPQVVMAAGQALAVSEHGGEVGDQLLVPVAGQDEGRHRFRLSAQAGLDGADPFRRLRRASTGLLVARLFPGKFLIVAQHFAQEPLLLVANHRLRA